MTKILIDRAVVEQALHVATGAGYPLALIAALKTALAEPQEPVQEPVAWSHINGTSDTKWHSPQRKPATIDEMFDRMDKAPRGVFFGHDPMTIWMEAWRAAEQHHGIREGA